MDNLGRSVRPALQDLPVDLKRCPDCGVDKSRDAFHLNQRRPDGLAFYCKECAALRRRQSYARQQAGLGRSVRQRREAEDLPEGVLRCLDCAEVLPLSAFPRNRNMSLGRHPYCKPCHNARGKESKERLHGGSRHYHLMRRYGIGAADVERMIEEQNGLCAICEENPPEHVDHDHETGEVRGILCFNCNGGLGQFRDRVDILKKAITYLERTRDPLWLSSDSTDDFPLPTQRQEAALSPTSCGQLHLIF